VTGPATGEGAARAGGPSRGRGPRAPGPAEVGTIAALRVAVVFGTRPEATKMAPVILELRRRPGVEAIVVSSGQHRHLLPQTLAVFGLRPDIDLAVMSEGQSLTQTTVRVLEGCARVLPELRPDVVLVHGDTTTTMAAALSAFYARIPVGHVEAGLRTGDKYSPFPEEMNRLVADRIADLHFAPTALAASNLAREGIAGDGVFVTGNTGIDGLLLVAGPRRRRPPGQPRLVLVEAHRRENLGEPMARIAAAVRELRRALPQVEVVWSVHPNPEVEGPVRRALAGEPGVRLVDPPDFATWAGLMAEADLLLTDSGGMQEEAPALGLPVLVLRDSTERPEVVRCGAGLLVGTDPERIVAEAVRLLTDAEAYAAVAGAGSPFGDGRAAERTVDGLLYRFGLRTQPPEPFRGAAAIAPALPKPD
jgi:UDP-N-acetylglucosamine 2-epimerase (non-hydrolysing)